MAEFNIRSDAVDVEQIMRQIRARIREKRGIDYTEDEIRRLASVKLEKFLEPSGVRSDLIEQFRVRRPEPPEPPTTFENYAFEDDTLFVSHRGLLRAIRGLLRPVLKLLFNPGPLADVLHKQAAINQVIHKDLYRLYESDRKRDPMDGLYFEILHNLVLEMTRLAIEVKNLKMRVESLSSRLDFDERRARALEGVVQYKTGADRPPVEPEGPPAGGDDAGDGGEERKRRRRRRRRRGGRQGGDAAGPAGDAAATGAAAGAIDDRGDADEGEAPEGAAAGDVGAGNADTSPDAAERPARAWDEPAGDRPGDTDVEDQ